MTFVEATIIYLSIGAPFGALVFFSRATHPMAVSLLYAILTTLTWPLFGAYRLSLGLLRVKPSPSPLDDTPLETLRRLAKEVPTQTAELFEISGHPNPWVATNCYARARKKVTGSHIDRLSRNSIREPETQMLTPDHAVLSQPITANLRRLT